MQAETTIHSLTALIDSAIAQADQLFVLLQGEQQALLSEDHDSLETLSEQKLLISQSLDHLELQRQEILAHAGVNTDSHSMQNFLLANQQNAGFKPLLKSWQKLLDVLQKASDQNHLNGILLEKQRQHVKQALNLLFEQSSNPSVYDASGGTDAPKYTRSVGVV